MEAHGVRGSIAPTHNLGTSIRVQATTNYAAVELVGEAAALGHSGVASDDKCLVVGAWYLKRYHYDGLGIEAPI
jgi:hypothetical protein